jgi:hypothetical protein
LEGYSISTFTYCAAASQHGTTYELWYLIIEHMDPMTSPSRWEHPRTASLDSEAKVCLTAHLAVLTLKSVNFEPAGYPLRSILFASELQRPYRGAPTDELRKGSGPPCLMRSPCGVRYGVLVLDTGGPKRGPERRGQNGPPEEALAPEGRSWKNKEAPLLGISLS